MAMNKPLKIGLIVLASFVGLLVAAMIVVPLVFDPNDYKPRIESEVESATGRSFSIEGDIELSFFPWIGASIGKVLLGNAEGFGDQPMASLDAVDVKVKLLPLLSGDIQTRTIVLDTLVLNLARKKDGTTNWDDLTAEQSGSPKPDEGQADKAGQSLEQQLAKYRIQGLEITDSKVSWKDEAAGADYEVSELDFSLANVYPGEPSPLSLKAHLASGSPVIEADISLDTTLSIDFSENRALLDAFSLALDIATLDLAADKEDDTLSGSISLDADIAADWDDGFATLTGMRLATDLAGPLAPGSKAKTTTSAGVRYDWKAGTLAVKDLLVQAYGLEAAGALNASNLNEKHQYRGNLAVKPFSLKKTLALLGTDLKTKDPDALSSVSAQLEFTGSTNSLSIPRLQAAVDETNLEGKATVSDFKKPAAAFNLKADQLVVDRYLPPPSQKSDDKPAKTPDQTSTKDKDPLAPLKTLDLDGKVEMARLTAYKVTAEDVMLHVLAKNGVIRVDPLSAGIYDGSLKLRLVSDVNSKTPKNDISLKLDSMLLESLVKSFSGGSPVGGSASLALDVSGQGLELMPLLKSLDGKASLSVLNGFIKGFRLEPERFNTKQGYVPAPGDEPKLTEFKTVHSEFVIKDGVATTRDFSLSTNLHTVTGGGKLDLAEQTMDTTFKADLGVMVVPVVVTGSWTDPKVNVDAAGMLTDTATKGVGKVLEKPADVGKKLLDDAGGFFGFGKKDKSAE